MQEQALPTFVTIFPISPLLHSSILTQCSDSNVYNIFFCFTSAIVCHSAFTLVCTPSVAASSRSPIPLPYHLSDNFTPLCTTTALSSPLFYGSGRQKCSRLSLFPGLFCTCLVPYAAQYYLADNTLLPFKHVFYLLSFPSAIVWPLCHILVLIMVVAALSSGAILLPGKPSEPPAPSRARMNLSTPPQ